MRNIPFIATPDEIKEYLSKAGPVIDFLLKTDPETRKSKGHGFCEYANRASAELAIQQCLSHPNPPPLCHFNVFHVFIVLL